MDQIVEWAKELQSLAQAGLYYGHDIYDKERYRKLNAGGFIQRLVGLLKSQRGMPRNRDIGSHRS
jgi:hypothetical protein